MKKRFTKKGFTVLELLLVVAVVAVLATIITVNSGAFRSRATAIEAAAQMQAFQLALDQYLLACQQYPPQGASGATIDYAVSAGCATGVSLGSFIPEFEREDYDTVRYVPLARTGAAGECIGYHVGVTLDDITDERLSSDTDESTVALSGGLVICTNGGAPGVGVAGIDPVLDYVVPRTLSDAL